MEVEDYSDLEDDYGILIGTRGQLIYDEIAYLTYWQGIEDERDKH